MSYEKSKLLLMTMGLALTAGNLDKINKYYSGSDLVAPPLSYAPNYGSSSHGPTKCARHFANKKKRNRARNKAARKSRAINRA